MKVLPAFWIFIAIIAAAALSKHDVTTAWDSQMPKVVHPKAHASSRQRVVDYEDVKQDLRTLLTTPNPEWPADFDNHYGPLMIRMAWHCAGGYRESDGRGGCDGARQRFEPERSWPDNTNLDKARGLLQPLKLKYGSALSFGDLMILAGTTSIEMMGGPVMGFCGGRVDDADGTDSLELGPTANQEALMPCPVNGQCKKPLGQSVLGLIYVNPEGVMGKPVPEDAGPDIRDVFGRMAMNDSETVALIGGGHAFGKSHGACPSGAGPSPKEAPMNPWPGTCGKGPNKGKGPNAFTSGMEGAWTTTPTRWSNQYFKNLLEFNWQEHTGPGGHHQWRPLAKPNGTQPPDIMMFTTDVALITDDKYLELVRKFAESPEALEHAFKHAWYKLVTRDMGPVTRCLGNDVPPAQAFQYPLPSPPSQLVPFTEVARDVTKVMWARHAALKADVVERESYYGALFISLAYECAATFRQTDYAGGCNGARIRFSPQKDWPSNAGFDKVLKVLADVKGKYDSSSKRHQRASREDETDNGPAALSWADLIVLAGTTAIQQATAARTSTVSIPTTNTVASATSGSSAAGWTATDTDAMMRTERGGAGADSGAAALSVGRSGQEVVYSFCGGRVDAEEDGSASHHLAPREYPDKILQIRDDAKVKGLTFTEAVALAGRPRSVVHQRLLGYSGSWTNDVSTVSNRYFIDLLSKTWTSRKAGNGLEEYTDGNGNYMLPTDLAIKYDPELAAIAMKYATDEELFRQQLVKAWTKLMNADRFDGPNGNVCEDVPSYVAPQQSSA